MPQTFIADDFDAAAAPESGRPFKPDDFNTAPVPDIFAPADFSANAPAQKANTREARRIELKLEMQRVRAEPEAKVWGASPRGPLSSIVEGVNKGAGAVVRGLGHLMESIPPNSNPDVAMASPGNLEDPLQKEYEAKVADPLKFKEAIERNPLTQAGKYMQETGEAFAPEDFERESVVNQALSGAAELAPVMNPAAPVIIGLQGLGRDLQNDFDQLKEKGASDQDAAAGAIRKAEAAGFSQFAVWSVLPAPLRKLGEKYLIARVGEDGAKRFLAGRIATGGEGAVLGGTTKAVENVATGQPPGEDVGKSALGMATLNLGLPRLGGEPVAEGRPPTNERNPGTPETPTIGPKAPTKPPEVPGNADLGTKVPVTRDLAAELQAAMKGNQVSPPDTIQKDSIPAAEKSAGGPDQSEAVKDNLIGQAVEEITGQIPGAKVTIEAPPAEAKPEFTAEDFDQEPEKPASLPPLGSPPASSPRQLRGSETEQAPQSKASDAKQSVQSEPGRPGENVEPTPGEVKPEPEQSDDPKLIQARNRLEQLVTEGKSQSDFAYRLRARIGRLEQAQARLEQEQAAAPGEPRVRRGLRARAIFNRETEMNGPDILSWIEDNMRMLSRTSAQKLWPKEKFEKNKSLWDDAPRLQRPHHHVIYSEGGSTPDRVAQAAADAGVLEHGDVDELWAAVDKASKTRSKLFETQRRNEKILQEEAEQAKRWHQVKASGHIRLDAEELEEGDTMELAGEQFKVTAKDPQTGDVTLEDGSKFGTQRLASGDSVYVEKLGEDLDNRLAEEPTPYRVDSGASEPQPELREENQPPDVQRREQRGDNTGRIDADKGEQAGENKPDAGAAGSVQPAPAEAVAQEPRQRRLTVPPDKINPGDRLIINGHYVVADSVEIEGGDRGKIWVRVHLPDDASKWARLRIHPNETFQVTRTEMPRPPGQPRAPKPTPEPPKPKPGQMDLFEQWLDKAIAATDPLRGNRMMEGVMGAPVWLTETLVHGALKTFRVAYRASKNLKASIEEALLWLHEQQPKGFDANEARDWLNEVAAKEGTEKPEAQEPAESPNAERPPKVGERDWKTVQDELGQASTDLRAQIADHAGSKKERQQRVSMATAKLRNLQEELQTHPGYVEDLMTRHHELSEQLKAESDDAKRNELRYKAEQLASELGETPEALRNRVHQELQEKGVLPKPPTPAPAGRTLDDLTDWMKQQGVDSPKRSLMERLDIARNLAERWQNTKDSLERARVGIAASWRAGLESIKHPPIDTGFRNAFKEWLFYDTYTGAQTKRWITEIKSKVESPLRRMAMSVWLDAKGDEGLLRYQLAAVPERFAPVWKTALELTAGEKELARKIKADFEQKLNDGKNAGLLEKGRTDYGVPQRWKKAPEPLSDQGFATADGPKGSPGNWRAKLDPRDPFFSFQREHPTYFEGIMHGGIPEGLDIADLVAVYHEAFHKSLSSRAAIWAMKNELASDGRPLVKISGAARLANEAEPGTYFVDSKARDTSDVAADGQPYRPIDHFALRDWKVANKTADGNLVMVRGDMLVHPEVYDFLKNELLKSPLREGTAGRILNPIFRSSAFLKSSKLALGTFHLATIAEHAFFHDVTGPITMGFEIDLRQPDQALLVKHGMELGLSGPQAAFEEGLSSHGGLFEHVPGLGDLSRKFSDWLFKTYIPEVSMKTGLTVLERNRSHYAGKLSDGQIAELTAHQMNAAFGLQNYRLLGSNKVIMDLNQLALLAPQFLFSRAKVVGQALKPYGAEQRRMLFLQAATLYVGARLLNSLFNDGDAHWEPRNAFSLVIKGRAYSIRTIVGDAWHMLTDFKSFASGRLAPLVRIAIETITQRDLRTGARKEPPFQTEWMPSRIVQNFVVDLAKWLAPVGVEGMLPGAAGREQGPVDTALASVGIGSRKYTAQTEVKEWARDFNRKGDAHARTYQRQLDAEAHGETAYRKLDALLDAGKLAEAATEYEALQNDGHKPKSIAGHYDKSQPLTGTKVRDEAFLKTLDEKQKQVYQRALAERKKRQDAFDELVLAMKLSKVAP